MNELALFAGAGGGILGGKLLGWRTVCAVERDAYAAAVLAQRQNDGLLDLFPIWSDVETFDGKPWRGIADVVSGGFPCQDISCAGPGKGLKGKRSGLWREFARIIRESEAPIVWVENSPILTSRGLNRVLWDLASMGYDAEWGVLAAEDVGALHKRERIWILAYSRSLRQQQFSEEGHEKGNWFGNGCEKVANSTSKGFSERRQPERKKGKSKAGSGMESKPERCGVAIKKISNTECLRQYSRRCGDKENDGSVISASGEHRGEVSNTMCAGQPKQHSPIFTTIKRFGTGASSEKWGKAWWSVEPALGRVANGVAYRVDRIKAIGNGQVPLQMVEAWNRLSQRINIK